MISQQRRAELIYDASHCPPGGMTRVENSEERDYFRSLIQFQRSTVTLYEPLPLSPTDLFME